MKTTMKTIAFLSIAAFIFMGGCLSKLATIPFTFPTETTVRTSSLPAGTHIYGESKVTASLDSFLQTKGASLEMLDELKLNSAKITIQSPTSANFDAIDNVELWISG